MNLFISYRDLDVIDDMCDIYFQINFNDGKVLSIHLSDLKKIPRKIDSTLEMIDSYFNTIY